jgi:hypothetical protein
MKRPVLALDCIMPMDSQASRQVRLTANRHVWLQIDMPMGINACRLWSWLATVQWINQLRNQRI